MVLMGTVTLLSLWGNCSAEEAKPSGVKWSELQRRYEGVFVLSASRSTRKVALTFDDVPDPRFTPKVLDVLRRKKVPATFFVVGTRSAKYPDIVRRIHREGHNVGNHSYNHPDFSKLPLSKVQEQIGRAEKVIEGIIGFKPRLVRPPYGEILPRQLEWAKKRGYTVVNWDVDSSDWRQLSADRVFRNVIRTVKPGSIVLMHAGGGKGQSLSGTVRALPRIIDWLREHDYEPVTLTELLRIPENRKG
ncbi:polysaccharide deacetylase family protein [Cohnella sp. NL03-T5]|nr:polysaccharide deacetylase family protein [Cohnella silvisoli]